ncbi:helix-turn-helix transcriptional regulator [Erwinia aphidicola]|uniref:helix-turn-helix transcriptional regulator n=1 Tax=Erwinia aphidicola TaxID=68334 RepID=UPI003CEDD6D2
MSALTAAEKIIYPLIPFWEDSDEPWGAKDHLSRFIYVNARFKQLLNIPVTFSAEGRYDGELPASTAEFEKQFREHDRACEARRDRVTAFEVHPYEKQLHLQPWFFDKFPIIGEDKIVYGTIFHGRPVNTLLLAQLNKIKVPTSLIFTPPAELFSPREWEIIFYVLQSYTTKDIGQKLNLSVRTVGNHIQNIFAKVDVRSRSQLIEYCHANNIANYIPQSFFVRCESVVFLNS